ncbi:MAG TPA: tetratricopeptide repeat protein [Terracidiphilus sp.]
MDTQTRHALKGDKFAQAAASSVDWFSGHRSGVVRWAITAGVVVLLCVGALLFWNIESSAAATALARAMDTYTSPLAEPGMPPESGTYRTSAERAKAANTQFQAVAQKYGWLPAGKKALYLAGVTDEDMGDNAAAESALKSAAGTWNRDVSNLAKLALAGLYQKTGRESQAIDLYNAIIAKPSETVSAATAQLDLADLYSAEGKQDQARALWAKVKDSDKEGQAGAIAEQKLSGHP